MPLLPSAHDRLSVPDRGGGGAIFSFSGGPKPRVPTLLPIVAPPAALTLTFELVVGERVGGV